VTVAGLAANTNYYFRVTAVSEGVSGESDSQVEEGNIEFFECRTESASGPIVFDGIVNVEIPNSEAGVNEADVTWNPATGGFSGYRVSYHPVVSDSAPFNINDPLIQSIDIVDTNQSELRIVALDSFSFHAFSVRACQDLVADPNCINGEDGGGRFIVRTTTPSVAPFSGITAVRNDPNNPSNVFLDFLPANLGAGGIFDEYRVFINNGSESYDITNTNATTNLGALFPSAPATFQNLYLDSFGPANLASTFAQLNGLSPGVLYEADVQAWVSRTVPLPISGGTITEEYGSEGTVPQIVSNSDTTPPQIIGMTVTPFGGIVGEGETITFVVTYDENLFVSGTPRLNVNIGGVIRNFDRVSETAQSITFEYTAVAGDNDLDGIKIGIGSSGAGVANAVGFAPATGSNSHSFGDVNASLVECSQEYQVVVRSVDGAGLRSSNALSALTFRLDRTAPNTPGVTLNSTTSDIFETPEVQWTSVTDNCFLSHYELAIGRDDDGDGFDSGDVENVSSYTEVPGGASVTNFTALSGVDGFTFSLNAVDDFRISIRAVDQAGNPSATASSVDFQVDIAGPDAPTDLAIAQNWITGADPIDTPQFTWTNPDIATNPDYDHTEVALGTTIGGNEVAGPTNVGNFSAFAYNGLSGIAECAQVFPRVVAFDTNGNPSAPATNPSVWFSIDNTAPTASGDVDIAAGGEDFVSNIGPLASLIPFISGDNCNAISHFEIAIGFDDDTDGFDIGDLDNTLAFTEIPGGNSVNNYQPANGVDGFFFNFIADADYFVSVRAVDEAGNASTAVTSSSSFIFILDNTSPDVTITSAATEPTTSTTIPITITFSEDVENFEASDITVANGTLSGFTGGPSIYTANITPDDFGRVFVDVAGGAAQDSSANPNNPAPQFSILFASAQSMRTRWTLPSAGSITLPLRNGFVYDVFCDWGDGTGTSHINSPTDPDRIHTYASAGTFNVTCTGQMQSWFFNNGGSRLLIDTVIDLGEMGWTNMLGAFFGCSNLVSVSGGVVDNVIDMEDMFRNATSLSTVDSASWNTSAVRDMQEMFREAGLVNPNTTNWDTSSVTSFRLMFDGAHAANPDTSNWDTSSATRMDFMFRNADAADPNTTNWDVSNVTTMASMFENADIANPNTSNWDTGLLQSIASMFRDAPLANPDVSNWDTSRVTNMGLAFDNADSATPNVSNWDTGLVTSMVEMFRDTALANPDVSNWNTGLVTNMRIMFFNADSANPNTTNWDTSRVSDMFAMFAESALINPDTSNWDTGAVVNMERMFENAPIAQPNTANWDTSRVTNMRRMFRNAAQANPDTMNWNTALVVDMEGMFENADNANPNTTNWNTGLVTDMQFMFSNNSIANPDTTNWDVSNVTNMQFMFRNADSAIPNTINWNPQNVTTFRFMFQAAAQANPDMTNWDVSSATRTDLMFASTSSAQAIGMTNWNTSNITNMDSMFENAVSANPDTTNWDVSNVTNMRDMFRNADSANPDTTNWDVSSVTNMREMFRDSSTANPNVTNWNTSSLVDMFAMFFRSISANPNMSNWNFASVTDQRSLFPCQNVSFSNANYANYLIALEATTGNLGTLRADANCSEFPASAATARANLISNGWTINDNGAE